MLSGILEKLNEKENLIEGTLEIAAGTGALFLGTVMAMKFKGHGTASLVATLPVGAPLIAHGINKIKKYRKEHPIDYEVSSFSSLPNYCVWDTVPNKPFSID